MYVLFQVVSVLDSLLGRLQSPDPLDTFMTAYVLLYGSNPSTRPAKLAQALP